MYKFHSKFTSILPKIRGFTVVKLPGYYLLQYPGTGIKIVPGYPGIVPGYGRSKRIIIIVEGYSHRIFNYQEGLIWEKLCRLFMKQHRKLGGTRYKVE